MGGPCDRRACVTACLPRSHEAAAGFLGELSMTYVGNNPERELTELQQRFVDCYLSGMETAGNPALAAITAGYAEKNAVQIAHQLLQKPHVIAAIDAGLRDAIGTRLTVKAVAVIEGIIQNQDASLKLRGDMACKVIEYSGLIERTKLQKAKEAGLDGAQPLGLMTRQKLEHMVQQGVDILKMADEMSKQSVAPN